MVDDVFGNGNDNVNLKSQCAACSYGEMNFNTVIGNQMINSDSVYTVNLPSTTVTGANDDDIRIAAINQATIDFGDSPASIADKVMVCLPPGTSGGWIAYAYIKLVAVGI